MGKAANKSSIPIFTVLVLSAILLLFIVSLIRKPVQTEIVRYGAAENKISVNAYLIRDEYVVNSPESGVLNCLVDENVRVSKNTKIASVFVGDYTSELQVKLKNVNEKIRQLEKNSQDKSFYTLDAASTETLIYSRVNNIINSVYNNDVSHAAQYKDDLNKLINTQKGEKQKESSTLSDLKQTKLEIEKQMSGVVSDIYAPKAGVFNSTIDGYEDYLSISKLKSITPEYLSKADSSKQEVSQNAVKDLPVVKISENYLWYVTATVSADWADSFKSGNSVKLRFPTVSDEPVVATINYISPAKDGKVAIVIACGEYVDNIFSLRKVDVEIIKSSYNGFKISKSAIRISKDGTSGVYVLKDRVAKFKKVNVLYNGESYIIAKEDNIDPNNVLLYDEVILNSKNMYDGKIVK